MEKVYQESYPLEVGGVYRELPIVPLGNGNAIASFVLPGDTELVNSCAECLAALVRPYQVEILVGIEAKGLPLIHQIATLLDMPYYVLIRKSQKVYMHHPLVVEEKSITTAGRQTFVLDQRQADRLKNRRVAFVDDVVSTGGSRRAAYRLINQAGGTIVCEVYVLKEGDWVKDQANLFYLGTLPIFEPGPSGGWQPVK